MPAKCQQWYKLCVFHLTLASPTQQPVKCNCAVLAHFCVGCHSNCLACYPTFTNCADFYCLWGCLCWKVIHIFSSKWVSSLCTLEKEFYFIVILWLKCVFCQEPRYLLYSVVQYSFLLNSFSVLSKSMNISVKFVRDIFWEYCFRCGMEY